MDEVVHDVDGCLSCWLTRGQMAGVGRFKMTLTIFLSHLKLINDLRRFSFL